MVAGVVPLLECIKTYHILAGRDRPLTSLTTYTLGVHQGIRMSLDSSAEVFFRGAKWPYLGGKAR